MTTTTEATTVLADLVGELEAAWNTADADRWGRSFTDDADFVNVRGQHVTGRPDIVEGHHGIFESIYRDSRTRISVISAEQVGDGLVLGLIESRLEVPAGPLQGSHLGRMTVLVTHGTDGWQIRAFQNTLVLD